MELKMSLPKTRLAGILSFTLDLSAAVAKGYTFLVATEAEDYDPTKGKEVKTAHDLLTAIEGREGANLVIIAPNQPLAEGALALVAKADGVFYREYFINVTGDDRLFKRYNSLKHVSAI